MISLDYVTEWRARAPWVQDFQVEQDLVISRPRGRPVEPQDLYHQDGLTSSLEQV